LIGQVLRIRYEILESLIPGQVFSLYRALDRVEGREVNVRIVESPFSGEVGFLNRLREFVQKPLRTHGHGLEKFLDLDDHEGIPFLVSDCPDGRPLSEKIAKLAPYSVPVALNLANQIAESLDYLHQEGIVHGELTSSSVSVSPEGKVTLLQGGLWQTYGASRAAGPAVLPILAPYLAPEVSQGIMPSAGSDVYALGVLLYEMLASRRPFAGESAIAVASQHITAEVPNLRGFNSLVPIAVQELVQKALKKDPGQRYQSAKAIAGDLKAMMDAMSFGKPLVWPVPGTPEPVQIVETDFSETQAPLSEANEPAVVTAEIQAALEPLQPEISESEAPPMFARTEVIKGPPASQPLPVQPQETALPKTTSKSKTYVPPTGGAESPKPTKGTPAVTHRMPTCLGFVTYAIGLLVLVMVGGYWYWNASMPKVIKTPSMLGLSLEEAREVAKKQGLVVREIRREFSEKQAVGIVLKSDPPAGDQVKQHASVGLIISAGSRFVTVPDLKGVPLEAARQRLTELDLQILEPITYKRDRKVKDGQVVATNPEPRTKAERGTKVRLTVSSNDASDEPTARVRGTYNLRVTIPEGGNDTVLVRIDIVDDMQVRTIHEEEHRAGDQFEVPTEGWGDPVYFKIFYDGELVHQVEKSIKKSVGDR
jgi:serine/threonine protein kinase